MFKLKISSMVEIFWLIPLSGLFWFHSWYSIHYWYLVSLETPPTQSQIQKIALNNMLQDKYLKFSLSFQLLVTLRHDGPKSDIWHCNASWKVINHCTVHSSFIIQNKILCQFHLFMADHSYQIRILHLSDVVSEITNIIDNMVILLRLMKIKIILINTH